ncbi:hypothetical protein [Motilimonas pumila]|uniref:Uncharacterized protein n=1 Tax=Motilimonas pumila TaxID=2303987 RepID=A0A418YKJ1_9GAMM|nr:hypothetical protein [Motilimonas pumila]RJG51498.1 hypothetical protein D1Z90_01850 [Motilimonas pumila]
MHFSLPKTANSSLDLLIDQMFEIIESGQEIDQIVLKKILDQAFSQGESLDKIEQALGVEVDMLESSSTNGVKNLLNLLAKRE